MNAYANVIQLHARRGAPAGPRFGGSVAPAGQVATWSPAGTPVVSYQFDGAGNSVSVDASGNPISGTVYTASNVNVADSVWTGAGGSGGAASGANAVPLATINSVSSILGQSAPVIQAAILSGDATQRQALLDSTNVQIATLNNQAALDRQNGNIQAANIAAQNAITLQQFQTQAGLTTSSNTMTTVLIGGGILAALAAVVLIVNGSGGGGGSARRSSARRNPSGRRRRRSRRARR